MAVADVRHYLALLYLLGLGFGLLLDFFFLELLLGIGRVLCHVCLGIDLRLLFGDRNTTNRQG